MKKLPIAKNTNIVEQESGKEVLLYDLKTHRFFNLNETSAIIYRACDGLTTFADLKSKHKFTDDLIYLALDELKRNDLLDDYQSEHFGNMSRRAVIKKVGLTSMIALPMITGMVAPLPVNAASGGCTSNAECPPATVCDGVTGTCVECTSNVDCIANPTASICDSASNTCVECFTDSDCVSGAAPLCVNNTCTPA